MVEQGVPRFLVLATRLLAVLPAFVLGLGAQALALRLAPGLARHLPVYFHRYLLFVFGITVERIGTMQRDAPVLIVSNHLSWLDILVISAQGPVSFIAKSEVAEWPFFGTLARLQRSIFVERARREKTGDVTKAIAARLQAGDAMVLFAEGTTSDGTRILPLRSALIGAAQGMAGQDDTGRLQSLTITYPAIGGLPSGRAMQPFIAWYGDMALLPHLCDLLTLPGLTARISFGPAHPMPDARARKAITRQLEQEMREARYEAATGRSAA